jgi:hypothetical protein
MTTDAERPEYDWDGRAQAMELVIEALMANYCRDPAHPTLDEMRKVYAEIKAMRVYDTEVPQHDD